MSDAYTQQYRPRVLTGIQILPPQGEDENRAIADLSAWRRETPVVAFSVLPEVGDEILVDMLDGQSAVLEVISRLHWAKEVEPGQTEFHAASSWVDVTLTCRQRSLSWSNDRRDKLGIQG